MADIKFDPKKLEKLNNPKRLIDIPPDYIHNKLNMKGSATIVEIGAGTAFFSVAFLKQFKASKIYACDISDTMVNWMKKNISPAHPGIIPLKSSENSVPLGDHTADLVFMIALHHELEDPILILEEAYRVLKPGGKVLVIDWKKKDMAQGPPLKIRCSPEQVEDQLIKSDFIDICKSNELQKHFFVSAQKRNGQ